MIKLLPVLLLALATPDVKQVVKSVPIVVKRHDIFQNNELRVMDLFIKDYETVAFDSLPINTPNDAAPFISMGQAYLNRYVASHSYDDMDKALKFFEYIAKPEVYSRWGNQWSSSPTAAYLLCGIYRAKKDVKDTSQYIRIMTLFDRGRNIAERESNSITGPYTPYISGVTDGDTKAEENAWQSTILAWSSQMYPDHPNARVWEKLGRDLAMLSIVRESDNLYWNNNQVITVEEDFTLTNHGLIGNPYYTVGTIMLLKEAALAYHMTGSDIPIEYNHNVYGLYQNYKKACSYKDGFMVWTIPANPVGSPLLFPIAGIGDDDFEQAIASQKAGQGYLWSSEVFLGNMIQDSKVFWYYLQGSYLWHY